MDELVRMLPSPLLFIFLDTSVIDIADDTASGDPDYSRAYYYCTDDVVFQKTYHLVYINILDYVPESLDHILNGFLTDAL